MEPFKNITITSRTQNPSGSVDLVIKAIDGTIFNILNCLSPEKTNPVEQFVGTYEVTAEDGTGHNKKAIIYFNTNGTHDLELTEEAF